MCMMVVRLNFLWMWMCRCNLFGPVHTISKESAVFSCSLNYKESYEIDVVTRGLFSCSQFYCSQSL